MRCHLGEERLVEDECRGRWRPRAPGAVDESIGSEATVSDHGNQGPRPRPATARPAPVGRAAEREPIRRVAQNRRARHEYDILDTFEAGLELRGAEVKSVRAGQVSLQDAYARVEDGEAWLLGARVAPYVYSSGFGAVEADRPRKLLLHRKQIDELQGRVAQQSLTLVPLSVYFKGGAPRSSSRSPADAASTTSAAPSPSARPDARPSAP